MIEEANLPVRGAELPEQPNSGQGRLSRSLRRVRERWSPDRQRAEGLAGGVREAGLEPLTIFLSSKPEWPSSPGAVIVHEPSPPDLRARLLDGLAGQTGTGIEGEVLALTPREWEIWAGGPDRDCFDWARPSWGEAPAQLPEPSDGSARRLRLQAAAGHYLPEFFSQLSLGAEGPARRCAEELRDRLELEMAPTRFPVRPGTNAPILDIEAATVGAFHTVFGAEQGAEPGEGLPVGAEAEQPPRSLKAARDLLVPMLADLPAHFQAQIEALYLVPGPWGRRCSWQVLVVLADEVPLREAGRMRRRLEQHLGMLPRGEVRGAMGSCPGAVVVTLSALGGLVRRRLFRRPLTRLSLRLHRQLLLGEDVILEMLEGPDFTPDDLRVELAANIRSTAACWHGASVSSVQDLLLGSWAGLVHLLRSGSPLAPLSAALAELEGSVDPAQSEVGRMGKQLEWWDPATADRGRGRDFLVQRGPVLVRLQEVAVEALG